MTEKMDAYEYGRVLGLYGDRKPDTWNAKVIRGWRDGKEILDGGCRCALSAPCNYCLEVPRP